MRNLKIMLKGILKENPVLVLLLGTCPTLAVTTSAKNAIGMGIAAMLVLMGSNVVISLLKNVIPDTVRIPCYIVVIAGFVTIVSLLVEAYVPDIYKALGIFLPLIVVNCIILGRAEMFANKNSVSASLFDGIGMGLGFTLALFIIGTVREILGAGTWMGITLTANLFEPITYFRLAPGGFFVFGLTIAVVNRLTSDKILKNKEELGCHNCPSASACAQAQEGGCK